jgi:hypothetical protein
VIQWGQVGNLVSQHVGPLGLEFAAPRGGIHRFHSRNFDTFEPALFLKCLLDIVWIGLRRTPEQIYDIVKITWPQAFGQGPHLFSKNFHFVVGQYMSIPWEDIRIGISDRLSNRRAHK